MQVDIQAPREIGRRIKDPVAVGLSDVAVTIQILIAQTSQSGTFLYGVIVNLLLTLKNAVGNIAHFCIHRMTDNAFHTITTECAISGNCLRQLGYLVPVGADVAIDVP